MQFIYSLRPIRSTFLNDVTDSEAAVVDRHFDYLERLCRDGKVLMAGRCLDTPFGIVILQAGSQQEASDIMEQDPAVSEGIMNAELHLFRVALWHADAE